MASPSRIGLRDILLRGLALLCAAWILILGLAAVSPDLHEGLHHRGASTAPDQCAVELLAHGAVIANPVMLPAPVVTVHSDLSPTLPGELFLDSPRYLLRPERGPPEA